MLASVLVIAVFGGMLIPIALAWLGVTRWPWWIPQLSVEAWALGVILCAGALAVAIFIWPTLRR